MIVSASYRTDIPAFYAAWFAQRLALGHIMVANPYGGRPYRVALRGDDVDGFVFWSRNMLPFRNNLAILAAPFMVQYTITGYPRALEPSVLTAAQAIDDIKALARQYGGRAVVWRYDPIVFADLTDAAFHCRNFSALAGALKGSVDEVCVSFAQIYRKSRRNLDLAAQQHGFTWRDPDWEKKHALLAELQAIAAAHGMRLTVCSQPRRAAPVPHVLTSCACPTWPATPSRPGKRATARAVCAPKAATSAPTTPAPTAAPTATPSATATRPWRIIAGMMRTTSGLPLPRIVAAKHGMRITESARSKWQRIANPLPCVSMRLPPARIFISTERRADFRGVEVALRQGYGKGKSV